MKYLMLIQSLEYKQQTGLQTLPHRFDIDFSSGNNELEDGQNISRYLPSIDDASITSFSVDYGTKVTLHFLKIHLQYLQF